MIKRHLCSSLIAAIGTTVGLFGIAEAASTTVNQSPVTVFVAKKIITMDPSWPEATTVAVQDGKILSVGRTMADIEPWLKNRKYTVDETFKDKILTPGFIESHGHPTLGGLEYNLPLVSHLPMAQPYGDDFPGVKNAAEGIALIKKYVSEAKDPNQPLLVFGWDLVVMGVEPDRTMLDKIAPNQPLAVWDASAHQVFVNTAMIKQQKLGKELIKLPGTGVDANGELNGKFKSVASAAVVLRPIIANLLKPENMVPRLRAMLDMSLKGGITTQSELMLGGMNLDAELVTMDRVYNQPGARTRLVAVSDRDAVLEKTKDIKKGITFVKGLEKKSTDMLGFRRGVKFFADDAFISQSMAMAEPGYADGHKGFFNTEPNVLTQRIWPWWEAGFQIYVHSNGSEGNIATLNTLAELQEKKFRLDHRFAPQHFGLTQVEMARKMKTLGGMTSVNPYYVYYRGEFNAKNLGADRAFTAVRLKTLVDAGVPVALHSDSPMGPPRPLEWVWIAVNRPSIESDAILAPAERVTVEQAMRMITVDAAYHLGMENKIGSIEAGKLADFTVLEQDPFTVDPMKIRDIPIWGTVLGGRPQAITSIVPQKELEFRDYRKLMAGLGLNGDELLTLKGASKTSPTQQATAHDHDDCSVHGMFELFHKAMLVSR